LETSYPQPASGSTNRRRTGPYVSTLKTETGDNEMGLTSSDSRYDPSIKKKPKTRKRNDNGRGVRERETRNDEEKWERGRERTEKHERRKGGQEEEREMRNTTNKPTSII
jgi:hypothetical protein